MCFSRTEINYFLGPFLRAPKVRSRSGEVATLDEVPRISLRVSSKLPSSTSSLLSSVITALARTSACPWTPNNSWESVKWQTLCNIKPLEIQIAQHHFNYKTVNKKQRTAGGMPHPKPTDLDMTKHSDYFVWKDTSERVARRCDDTVDKKQVNSCVLNNFFLEGVEQPKISPKNPGNGSALRRATSVTSSKFRGWSRKKKLRFQNAVFQNRVLRGFNLLNNSN